MSIAVAEQALKSDVIDPQEHARLIKEIESVARRANIPVQMVWTSMTKFCTEDEVEYVREFRRMRAKGAFGLVYVGTVPDGHKRIIDRMSAVAGALIRNKINAQVMMVGDVIREQQAGTLPNPTALLIPNFYDASSADIPKWRSGALLDMLYSRQQEGAQTFIYVSDWKKMEADYGSSFGEHLKRFVRIAA